MFMVSAVRSDLTQLVSGHSAVGQPTNVMSWLPHIVTEGT